MNEDREEIMRKVAWVKRSLPTRKKWTLRDYREFYNDDVPALVSVIEHLAGCPIPAFRDPNAVPGSTTEEEAAFLAALSRCGWVRITGEEGETE